jgi:hypothetical protein
MYVSVKYWVISSIAVGLQVLRQKWSRFIDESTRIWPHMGASTLYITIVEIGTEIPIASSMITITTVLGLSHGDNAVKRDIDAHRCW